MKKVLLIIIILSLLFLPVIAAKNVEVIIEHKTTQSTVHNQQFTVNNLRSAVPPQKYEIKTITEEKFAQLKQDTSILVQENIPKHIFLSESVPLIEADKVWNLTESSSNITGEGQTVCILDTGAQTTHPVLIGKNATCNIDCINTDCIEDCSKTDPNGHGTHVAGIIVSTDTIYHGVTQQTKYIPVMVCDSGGVCSSLDVLEGIDWCITNKDAYNISVISMSLGVGQETSYCDNSYPDDAAAINNAVANNITVVTATGNLDGAHGITNHSAGISEPACIENATRVGNTDDTDNMADSGLRHNFFTDIIAAPGVNIHSTWSSDSNSGTVCDGQSYCISTGTSMSAPHVSGVIALLNQYKKLESNTILSPSTIKSLLLSSGVEIDDMSESGINYSRVNVYQAVNYANNSILTKINSPSNNLNTNISNITFNCSADSFNETEITQMQLNIFKNNSIYYNETKITSALKTTQTFTFNFTEENFYTWNCESIDSNNIKNSTQNYSITYDSSNPQTTLTAPNDSLLTSIGNQTFSCNATDNLQLTNLTLNIYNSTGLFYNTTNSSPTSNTLIINKSINLSTADTYTWNCLGYDNQSLYNQTVNRTLSTSSIQATLTPTNNTFTNINETTFNCSAQSTNNLSNITLNIYNGTQLTVYSQPVTGLSNYSTFNHTFPSEDGQPSTVYQYNCLATNNLSQSSTTENYTITYDIIAPQINLTSPTNGASEGTTSTLTKEFKYNETEINKNFCNLTLNGVSKSSFTQSLSPATYTWSVNCTDKANNTNTSDERTFIVTQTIINTPSTSSSGGGGSSTPRTYTPTETQIKEGYKQTLREKEIISFKIKSSSHKLTLNKIENGLAEITLESDPITLTLYLNSTKKINLDNDETFDLELTLLETNSRADIKIKEINETIPVKHILTPEANNINDTKEIPISTTENKTKEIKLLEENNNLLKQIIVLLERIIQFFKKLFPFYM
ncbi:MAG: S8 family serine peptidase [Nanoarchaeota archaeon]|jgi:serine protease AprX|nr:S8 family serine peptidase [Nanoarchaeota archaeon]